MFEILPQSQGSHVALRATGRLTHADYQAITPLLEDRIRQFGPLDLMADMVGFEGWDLRAAWDDFALGMKHLRDFRRIAMVGDRKWEEVCAQIGNRLMKAEVRFFPVEQRDAAWAWTCGEG